MASTIQRAVRLAALALLAIAPARLAFADTTVYAAASATEAITDIGAAFTAKKLGTIVPSFNSSSTLAKQIENGAPAGVFLSADEQWMDYLDQKKLIAPGTRSDLLGNSLVLIAPKSNPFDRRSDRPGIPAAEIARRRPIVRWAIPPMCRQAFTARRRWRNWAFGIR